MGDAGKALRVLIIGGSGVFGSRLAELAAREANVSLTLAGRNEGKLTKVAHPLDVPIATRVLDRDRVSAGDLAGFDLVVDAAGPFQGSQDAVIKAALAARVPYIDLADGRAFVREFPRFDAEAKQAGIPLITGASSIPALSHAVLDRLIEGWAAVDAVSIGIFPGNRAPRGLSVVEAILSYVGKPVRVFGEGEWQELPGWGMTHRELVPGIGKRWASICDTPEQDLLVARYKPRRSAEFFAGMELGLLHLGLAVCAMPVRWGMLKSLRPFAAPMLAIAQCLLPFGSDKGAMTVRVSGEGRNGEPQEKLWVLQADANRGPYVPVLAALALIRRFRDGRSPAPGARVCSGMLDLADFVDDMRALGMEQRTIDLASGASNAH